MWNQFFCGVPTQTSGKASHDSMYRDSSESFREMISPDDVMATRAPPRILLVDDDPAFLKIMKRAAEKKGADMTCCLSLEDFGALKNWDFDAVIMDFDLGAVTGYELITYIEQFTKEEVPVVLVSQTKRTDSKEWSSTIKEFIHKDLGPFAILDATFEAHEIARLSKII